MTDEYDDWLSEEEIKKAYREETGEELPDHVIENWHVLFSSDISGLSNHMHRQGYIDQENMNKRYETHGSDPKEIAFVAGLFGICLVVGAYSTTLFEGVFWSIGGGIGVALLTFSVLAFIFEAVGYLVDSYRGKRYA